MLTAIVKWKDGTTTIMETHMGGTLKELPTDFDFVIPMAKAAIYFAIEQGLEKHKKEDFENIQIINSSEN